MAVSPSMDNRRITTLDGLRGLMTIMVILSHYFGELRHGIDALVFGWIAVKMFFVLSGFLIGKLILERQHHANFFAVFYVRRFCRILPAYLVTVLAVSLLIELLPSAWTDANTRFPLWSYLTFLQGGFMVMARSIGAHWLAPTWTLGVEEQFYLLIPAMMVFTPRRWLAFELVMVGIAAIALRIWLYYSGANEFVALALLPGHADALVCGVLCATAVAADAIAWERFLPALRVTPIAALAVVALLHAVSPGLFEAFASLAVAVGCAAYILCIVHATPEARRYDSIILQFFGNNGYCLYLIHLPVLGLMHGLILGSEPDLMRPAQWLVTIASMPVCVLIGWAMTRLIEDPFTRYGRTWRWSAGNGGYGPSSDSNPASNCFGVGGQPLITRSTGTTADTPPTTA